jgi:hypothetical protein
MAPNGPLSSAVRVVIGTVFIAAPLVAGLSDDTTTAVPFVALGLAEVAAFATAWRATDMLAGQPARRGHHEPRSS